MPIKMPAPAPGRIAPRLFISYSHDSREHEDHVRNFADRLRKEGIDAIIDQYDAAPPDQWPMWMDREIQKANFIALICTETYLKRVEHREESGIGRGVLWEAKIIYNHLFEEDTSFQRFIPILFNGGTPSCIPWPIRGFTHYYVDTAEDYNKFLSYLRRGLHVERSESNPQRPLPAIAPQSYPASLGMDAERTLATNLDRRNRLQMLKRTRLDWIDGVLNRSLYAVARIELGLQAKTDAVEQPLRAIVQMPDQPPTTLPPGTSISNVFDEHASALFILGAPGTGKTTLLLELAKELLHRAEQEVNHPIPAVFNLSSWAIHRPPLEQWIVRELNERSDVPRAVAEHWLRTEQIIPLLDGLDEVAINHRSACVEAINNFRRDHGLLPIAVCSRIADYEALGTKIRLRCAIVVQPLTKSEVQDYLERSGEPMRGLRDALRRDALLWELLKTPLMLWIAMMAYCNSAVDFFSTDNLRRRRIRLFASFVDAMFKRRAMDTTYSRKQTLFWLSWLASAMKRSEQTIFYLEDLSERWLPTLLQRGFSKALVILTSGFAGGLIGAFFSCAVGTLLIKPTQPLATRFIAWSGFGLILGLVLGLIMAMVGAWLDIRPIEAVGIGLVKAAHVRRAARVGVVTGLVVALSFGLLVLLSNWLSDWLNIATNGRVYGRLYESLTMRFSQSATATFHLGVREILLTALFFGLAFGLLKLMSVQGIETRRRPNQGTRRSLKMALITGLAVGLIGGICNWLIYGPAPGVMNGITSGLILGFVAGGLFAVRHLALRLTLWSTQSAPLKYVRFLDFSAERIFLRKVGGGYIFIHRMLLEYFASLRKTSN